MVSVLTRSLQQQSALALRSTPRAATYLSRSVSSTARSKIGFVRKVSSAATVGMDKPTVSNEQLVEALRAVVPKLDSKS